MEKIVPEQTVYDGRQKLSKPRKRIIKQPFISVESKEKIKDRIIKDIWNPFDTKEEREERKRLEKPEREKQEHNKSLISNRIIRDVRTSFEQEDKNYLKPKIINSFWNNVLNIEYESSGDKSLSLNEYLNKVKTHLKIIIKDLQRSDVWKIQLKSVHIIAHFECFFYLSL